MEHINFNSVKRKIEKERCSKHNKHPKVQKTSKEFEVSACCEEFRKKMIAKLEIVMAEETKISIEKMLKKSFR